MKQTEVDQKLNRTAFADGPRLLADIGATHARFALQTAPGEFRAVRVLKCDDFPDIVALLRTYLMNRPAGLLVTGFDRTDAARALIRCRPGRIGGATPSAIGAAAAFIA